MSVFKKIDSNDVSITTFNAHKNYTINSYNYSGSSCGYGVQILGATHHSWSFGDAIHGRALDLEEKNTNGTYKSLIYDSIKHLYYARADKPSENFGGNLPEKETRDLQQKAHVISIPSPLYDLRIKSGSLNFTDYYIESLAIDREQYNATSYTTPVILAGNWRFESSQSKFTDSADQAQTLTDARPGSPSGIQIVTGSSDNSWGHARTAKVGTGSIHFKVSSKATVADTSAGNPSHTAGSSVYNVGNGLFVRNAEGFSGITNNNWWLQEDGGDNNIHGMSAYSITMWIKPPDWKKMPNNKTGAPGQSTLITRDKNSYFELNMMTSSYDINNDKGLLPLQMFWGATGSNCTTSASAEAISSGFGLATGSWNLVNIQQEFWPDIHTGTSGSQYEELPPWGKAAKTTLRIYRPDPNKESGYTYIKKEGYATASINDHSGHHWTHLPTRNVTSSIQYNRNMYIGASGSVSLGAVDNDPTSKTIYNAFTGSMDDIRFYESTLSDTQIANLYTHPSMDLRRTPPVTASFNLIDDGYGNIVDRGINSSSFANPKKLVGYYGFNELYTIENQVSKSTDYKLHDGYGYVKIKDYSDYNNTGVSERVKFVPGIASMAQSGSIYSAEAINFYQTNVRTGIRAQFNNSGSIRIPHHNKLNLGSDAGSAISFWIKIPENQLPGLNTITGTPLHNTTGGGGSAGGTSNPCINVTTGSSGGSDYVTLIGKLGLSKKKTQNAATKVLFDELVQGGDSNLRYPYHIQLKNTSYEKDGLPFDATGACIGGAQLNTIVLRRSDSNKTTILESKTALIPYIDNHVVVQRHSSGTTSIWINGKQDTYSNAKLPLACTDNISDVFLGDQGTAWTTGSIKPYFPATQPPQTPLSGSLDEIRFYYTELTESEVLSLYDNDLNTPSAYQTNVVGNVFYEHGITALTNTHLPKYFSGSIDVGNDRKGLFSKNFELKFQNTRELYEQKIKCHSKASDFNLTTNPTARKTTYGECKDILSVQELADFTKDPIFNPYVTTIGLYDDFGRLLAIAKLARPIQKLKNVDMTFIVKFDR